MKCAGDGKCQYTTQHEITYTVSQPSSRNRTSPLAFLLLFCVHISCPSTSALSLVSFLRSSAPATHPHYPHFLSTPLPHTPTPLSLPPHHVVNHPIPSKSHPTTTKTFSRETTQPPTITQLSTNASLVPELVFLSSSTPPSHHLTISALH